MDGEARGAFGELLKENRLAADLTQEALAERSGVSVRNIQNLERGVNRPLKDTARRLADGLGLAEPERAQLLASANPSPRRTAAILATLPADQARSQPPDEARPPLPAGMLTILIADMRGYTAYTHQHGDEAGARLAARFAALVAAAVTGQDGRVVEVRRDEVLAVFASARKALRAAVDVLEHCAAAETPELSLRTGLGLDVGEPVPVSGGYRGEVINVAALLCKRASPGEVLASDAVISLARRVEGLSYESRGKLELNGLSQPVRIWAISTVAPDSSGKAQAISDASTALARNAPREPANGYLGVLPTTPLVERESELVRLLAAIECVASGRGRLVLLSGEPGVGKTRLAQETLLRARARGFRLLVGRCFDQHASLPYYPVIDALTLALDVASPGLRALVPARFPELGRLVPNLLPDPPVLEGEEGRQRLLRAVSGFLEALAAEAPLALLLDDLHWADSASLHLMHHLANRLGGQRMLLLGTYRDLEVQHGHPLEGALATLLRERLVDEIALCGLSTEGTAALIAAHLPRAQVSRELVSLVQTRTGGIPFLTEELLKAWCEEGGMNGAAGAGNSESLAAVAAPHSVQTAIAQQVRRLPEATQQLLRVASVLGQEFDLAVLMELLEQDEDTLLDHLDVALTTHLLEAHRVGRQERYAFTNALIGQVLYEEVPRHRRRRFHQRAGAALERLHIDHQDAALVLELARHFLAAGDPEKASRYFEQAGDNAARLFAVAEAIQQYRHAVNLLQADDPVVPHSVGLSHIEEKMGDLRLIVGDYAAAHDDFVRARGQASDPDRRAELRRKEGLTWARRRDYKRALAAFSAALEEGGVAGPVLSALAQAAVALSRAEVCIAQNDTQAAEAAALQVLDLVGGKAVDPRADELAAGAHRCLGEVARRRKDLVAAEQHFRQALPFLDRIGRMKEVGWVWIDLGDTVLARQDPAAGTCFQRALAIMMQLEFTSGILTCLYSLARIALAVDDLRATEEYLRQCLSYQERDGDTWGSARCWSGLGWLALARGNLTGAEECRRRSLAARERPTIPIPS